MFGRQAAVMRAALFILAVVAAAAVAVPFQWLELEKARTITKGSRLGDIYTFCNTSLTPLIIHNVTISPDPPRKGQKLTVTVSYTLQEKLSAGKLNVSAKLDGFSVISKTLAICDVLAQEGVKCPVQPFSGSNSTTVQLPSIGGHVTGEVTATDQNGKQLGCATLDFELK